MEAAEAVIETTSSDVKVDALCVTARGIVAVGSKMDGRTWHGEVHHVGYDGGPSRVTTSRAGLTSLAIAPDGSINAGSDAGTIERWSSNGSGDLISSKFHGGGHVHDAAVAAVTCTSSGTIVSGGGDGAINLWDITGDTRLRTIPFAHIGSVHDLAASADGTMLASCGEDGYVRVWRMGHATTARTAVSAPSRHPIAERRGDDIRVGAGRAFCVAWCESVAALAIGFESGDVAFLDADRNVDSGWECLRTRGVVHAHGDAVRGLAFHDGKKSLASCGDDGVTAVHVGELPVTTKATLHKGEYARCVRWGEDGTLYSGGWDGRVMAVKL